MLTAPPNAKSNPADPTAIPASTADSTRKTPSGLAATEPSPMPKASSMSDASGASPARASRTRRMPCP